MQSEREVRGTFVIHANPCPWGCCAPSFSHGELPIAIVPGALGASLWVAYASVPSCPFSSSLHLLMKCFHIGKGQLLCFQVYNLLSEIHIQTSRGELFINAYDSGVFLD